MNLYQQIYRRIGEAAAWEQLGEEAAELSAAALKVARIMRGENPARVTEAEAFSEAMRELADTYNAVDVIDSEEGIVDAAKMFQSAKMTRWYNSLFGGDSHG